MKNAAAALGLLIGVTGIGIDVWQIIPPAMVVSPTNPHARNIADALIWFWTYFTHLSNLGLLLVYLANLTGWRWLGWFRKPQVMAAIGAYILLVMIYYHFMLAPYFTFEGAMQVATILLHYVAPVFYLGWWAAFAPHPRLRYADVPAMLVIGLCYLAWVLVRGAVVGEYPYEIVDVGKHGYGAVAIGAGTLLAAVVVFSLVMVTVDRLLGRRRRGVAGTSAG